MPKGKEYSSDFWKAFINALKQGLKQTKVVHSFKMSQELKNVWNKVYVDIIKKKDFDKSLARMTEVRRMEQSAKYRKSLLAIAKRYIYFIFN